MHVKYKYEQERIIRKEMELTHTESNQMMTDPLKVYLDQK